MKSFFYPQKLTSAFSWFALGFTLFFSSSLQAQMDASNSRPTLDPIPDHTTRFSTDVRYIELNGISAGDEGDQEVFIDVSTEDKDLIESIGADLLDNGKAVINYRLKEGAAGTAKVKVLIRDNGVTPASLTRTFYIMTEGLNRELEPKSTLEDVPDHNLKAFPNPASVSTRISFSTPNDEQRVAVDLHTLSGTRIKQLFTGSTLAHRPYYVDVNSRNLASGVYIVRLTGQAHTANLKLVVAK